MTLPQIMLAPNGARRTKADHPALPLSISEIVATAEKCFLAGATGIHAHIRDSQGKHILDAGLYQELKSEMQRALPDMYFQITTEAVGIYSPEQQMALVKELRPKAVSIGLAEMLSAGENTEISHFYHELAEQGTQVQHILYEPSQVLQLIALQKRKFLPQGAIALLFVLGRYHPQQISSPEELTPFLNAIQTHVFDWACCAFGQHETACLKAAIKVGGKARIGFENNLYHSNGKLAKDNAERVTELINALADDASPSAEASA